MKNKFFVMLNSQRGNVLIPLLDDNGVLQMFETAKAAGEAARSTTYGIHFGFEIHRAGLACVVEP
jgi:hypothetical protein